MFQRFHFAANRQNRCKGTAQNIFHRVQRRELRNLRDQANALVGVHKQLTGIKIHLSGQDLEQSGLSAAVSSKDGYALPLLDLKAQAIQKIFSNNKKLGKVLYLNINHVVSPRLQPVLPWCTAGLMPAAWHCCSYVPAVPAFLKVHGV